MKIAIILATSLNHVIGKDNKLPWHLPADLAFFKKTTMGHCVVMGRKTYESLKKPLSGRFNIVMSNTLDTNQEPVDVYNKSVDVFDVAEKNNEEELFIIGGTTMYTHWVRVADTVYWTRVLTHVEGDTHFDVLQHCSILDNWRLTSRVYNYADDRNQHDYEFIRLDRVPDLWGEIT